MTPRPLRYPLVVAGAAVFTCLSLLPAASPDGVGGLLAVLVVVLGYTGFRLGYALRRGGPPQPDSVRVRQRHRLAARSWLVDDLGWTPVYFDPTLLTGLPGRGYPAGRSRRREPPGRLRENPTRPDPDAPARAAAANRWSRRLLLDAQSAVGAPIAGFGWTWFTGGGAAAFAGATVVAAVCAVWLAAIGGSDPS